MYVCVHLDVYKHVSCSDRTSSIFSKSSVVLSLLTSQPAAPPSSSPSPTASCIQRRTASLARPTRSPATPQV